MQIANATDMADFKVLGGGVGDEILDGETIFAQMENSLKMKESYLASEEIYRYDNIGKCNISASFTI